MTSHALASVVVLRSGTSTTLCSCVPRLRSPVLVFPSSSRRPPLPASFRSPPLLPRHFSSSIVPPLLLLSSSSIPRPPHILFLLPFSLIILLPSLHVRPPRRLACLPSPLVSLPSPSSLSSSEVEKTMRNHCQGAGKKHSNSDRAHYTVVAIVTLLHHRRFCRSEQDRRSHLRGNGVC